MNFLLGATYGFASPIVLALAAPIVIGSVVYAYLRRGRVKPQVVPTLFLLKALQGASRSRRRFFPPIRFFFELLLLSLLILGSAGLYKVSTGDKYALVFDNSLSMATKTSQLIGVENFTEKGRVLARQFLRDLPRNSEVEVFVTSPTLLSLTDGVTSLSNAERVLDGIDPRYSVDKISEALQKINTAAKHNRILLITDKNRSTNPNTTKLKNDNIILKNVRSDIKDATNNLAINKLSFSSGNFGNASRVLSVALDAFSSREVSVRLIARGCNLLDECKKIELIGEKLVKLIPNNTSLEEFKNISDKQDIFFVELQSQDGTSSDANPLDNNAYLVLDTERTKSALISVLTPQELGLNFVEAMSFEGISPLNYEKKIASLHLENYSSLIFHRYAPKELPKANSIFVMPPQNQALFKMNKSVVGAEVTSWDVSSPLLNYLNVPGIRFNSLGSIQKPDWASDIISTTHGAGLVAGQSGNFRYAVFGFEIFPFEGRKTPTISVLTLNSLKWVANFSGTSGYQEVNTPLAIDSDVEKVAYSDGREIYHKAKDIDNSKQNTTPAEPGVLIIKKRDGGLSARAFNFFSNEESDLLNPGEVSVEFSGSNGSNDSTDLASGKSLIAWLSKIIFILIMIDLIFLLFRSLYELITGRREVRHRYGN